MPQSLSARRLFGLVLSNSVGFSATTAMPLWITVIGTVLAVPGWWGSVIGSAQLAAAAVSNLATPFLFRKLSCERLAMRAAFVAMIANLVMGFTHIPEMFATSALFGGLALGVLLSAVNTLLARSETVQGNYAIAQIMEVSFATGFYFFGGSIIEAFGLKFLFGMLAFLCLSVALLMKSAASRFSTSRFSPSGIDVVSYGKAKAIAAVMAFILFFVGQSSVWQHQLAIGNLLGLNVQQMGTVLSISMAGGFLGAFTAKLVGIRFGIIKPALVTSILMSIALLGAVNATTPISFSVCTVCIMALTMAMVPYSFAILAALDPSGRLAARGPAMLLLGVSGGPLMSELFLQMGSYTLVGVAGAIIVFMAGCLFLTAGRGFSSDASPAAPV